MMKTFLLLATLLTFAAPATPRTAHAPTKPAVQESGAPDEVVREFYKWYLGELNKDNFSPLKDRATALKYLTPEYHKRVPRLIEEQMVDVIICAQDFDEKWVETFTVGQPTIRGTKATIVVRLPPFGGGTDANLAIKIKTTLVKRNGKWRINRTDCVN
jgi:Protein of unknown function (DUF3828)